MAGGAVLGFTQRFHQVDKQPGFQEGEGVFGEVALPPQNRGLTTYQIYLRQNHVIC